MTTREQRIEKLRERYAAMDPRYVFTITDEDTGIVHAQGRPTEFIDAWMRVPQPEKWEGSFHVYWKFQPEPETKLW